MHMTHGTRTHVPECSCDVNTAGTVAPTCSDTGNAKECLTNLRERGRDQEKTSSLAERLMARSGCSLPKSCQ